MPWRYASYPAALPHVLGVSALARDGSVPAFSNRDARFNDIAAPGVEIFSTMPRSLTSQRSTCVLPGLLGLRPGSSSRRPRGRPSPRRRCPRPQPCCSACRSSSARAGLEPEQVVEPAHAVGAGRHGPDTGCKRCTFDRDRLSGWGRLDVAAAIDGAHGRRATPGSTRTSRTTTPARGRGRSARSQPRPRVGRLLGRPGRRLPRRPSTRRAAPGERARAGRNRHEPDALEARSSPPRRACEPPTAWPRSRREPGDIESVQLPRSRRPAGTSCRSRCSRGRLRRVLAAPRAPGRAATCSSSRSSSSSGTSRICRAGLPTTSARARDVPE